MGACMLNDRSMAYGFIDGDVPIAGEVLDANGAREVTGSLHWQTMLPDSNPAEGKLDVALFLFVDDDDVRTPMGNMRLESGLVSRLKSDNAAAKADAREALLAIVLKKVNLPSSPECFNIRCVQ